MRLPQVMVYPPSFWLRLVAAVSYRLLRKMPKYALGLDYGTNSARAVLVDVSDGAEDLRPASGPIAAAMTACFTMSKTQIWPASIREITPKPSSNA